MRISADCIEQDQDEINPMEMNANVRPPTGETTQQNMVAETKRTNDNKANRVQVLYQYSSLPYDAVKKFKYLPLSVIPLKDNSSIGYDANWAEVIEQVNFV